MRKAIKNYEGLYEVDEIGNVYGLDRKIVRKTIFRNGKEATQEVFVKGVKLRNYKAKNGYYVVNLNKSGSYSQKYVHFLVCQAFMGDRGFRMTINHIDGNKLNNNISNLEYCTYLENNLHAKKTGLNNHNLGDYVIKKPVSMICVKTGKEIESFDSIKDAQNKYGIKHIGSVANGNRKTAGGYKWKFK